MFLPEQMEQIHDAAPLMKKWDKRIETVAKNTSLTDHEAYTLAVLLDNTERSLDHYARRKALSDTTYSETVGPFKKHAMNIVSAVYSTFELKDIVSIQPITQKLGALYFLDYQYGTTKAPVTAGDTMFSVDTQPFVHTSTDNVGTYSSQMIDHEDPTITVNANTSYTATLAYFPIVLPDEFQVIVTDAATGAADGTYTVDSSATSTWTLTNGGSGTGTLDTVTGLLTIIDAAAAAGTEAFDVNYAWNSEAHRTTRDDVTDATAKPDIPRVTVSVKETVIQATRRQLLFEVSLDATYDFNQQFGRDLDGEMEAAVVQEVQNELAYHVLGKMFDGATGGTISAYDANAYVGSGSDSWSAAQDFSRLLSGGSMTIYKNLGRGHGNFIVSGSDFIAWADHLPSTMWTPTSRDSVRGPYKAGRLLNRYDVYHNPAFGDTNYMMGFKGSDWWEAPYYIGSYLPLMASKFMMFPDMHGEQGYISMDAHKYLFPQHVMTGTITDVNLPS